MGIQDKLARTAVSEHNPRRVVALTIQMEAWIHASEDTYSGFMKKHLIRL